MCDICKFYKCNFKIEPYICKDNQTSGLIIGGIKKWHAE